MGEACVTHHFGGTVDMLTLTSVRRQAERLFGKRRRMPRDCALPWDYIGGAVTSSGLKEEGEGRSCWNPQGGLLRGSVWRELRPSVEGRRQVDAAHPGCPSRRQLSGQYLSLILPLSGFLPGPALAVRSWKPEAGSPLTLRAGGRREGSPVGPEGQSGDLQARDPAKEVCQGPDEFTVPVPLYWSPAPKESLISIHSLGDRGPSTYEALAQGPTVLAAAGCCWRPWCD